MTARAPRAMTILEVLLAVSMLAALGAGAASWIASASAAAESGVPQARWRAAAGEALRLIADDLARGDALLAPSRAEVRSGRLHVLTRLTSGDPALPSGPAVVVYRLDGDSLVRDEHEWRGSLIPASPPRRTRVLLGRAAAFSPAVDAQFRLLSVTLGDQQGASLSRRYALP